MSNLVSSAGTFLPPPPPLFLKPDEERHWEPGASVCSIEKWKNQVPVDTINLLKLSTPLTFIGKR